MVLKTPCPLGWPPLSAFQQEGLSVHLLVDLLLPVSPALGLASQGCPTSPEQPGNTEGVKELPGVTPQLRPPTF